jgi:site-specific recombinase XerD
MIEKFRNYLQGKRYMASTVDCHVKSIVSFLEWVIANNLYEIENVGYNDLLSHIQFLQEKKLTVHTINIRLLSISKYFEFLKEEKLVTRNPARTLRIKGKMKTITEQPLKYADLEVLYFEYKKIDKSVKKNAQKSVYLAHQRNIIIVGLLVWQGLHSGELEKLEVSHINLDEGKIYIPSGARSNSRTLQLHVQQVVQLHTYLHGGIREQMKMKADKLFAARTCDIVQHLLEELKGLNPIIKNAQHIRASVILNWLKQYNKRQVQYMAGHRYIDSTERYAIQETDSLTDLLVKHHPFG